MSAVVLKNTIGRSRPLVNESFILSSKLMIEVKVAKDNDPQAVFEIVSWGSVNLPIHVCLCLQNLDNKLVKIVKYFLYKPKSAALDLRQHSSQIKCK